MLNARLGIIAAVLGLSAAWLSLRESSTSLADAINPFAPPGVAEAGSIPPAPAPVTRTQPAPTIPKTSVESRSAPPAAGSPPSRSDAAPTISPSPANGAPAPAHVNAPATRYSAPAPPSSARAPERYVNPDVLAGGPRVALLVMRGDEEAEQRVASGLSAAGVNARTGAFTRAAFRDGVVDRLFAGDADAMSELGLSAVNGHLVIGRLSFDPVQNTMNDLMMTHASLSVQIVPLGGGSRISRVFRARGAGFNESAALQQAESRVVHDLAEALASL